MKGKRGMKGKRESQLQLHDSDDSDGLTSVVDSSFTQTWGAAYGFPMKRKRSTKAPTRQPARMPTNAKGVVASAVGLARGKKGKRMKGKRSMKQKRLIGNVQLQRRTARFLV